jgi:uncharacterized protein
MTTSKTDSRIFVEKPSAEQLKQLEVTSWPIWTKEVSTFDWHYSDREVCYFLEGDVIVKTTDGEVRVGKGDLVTFAKGLDCTWQVSQPVRKHYQFG